EDPESWRRYSDAVVADALDVSNNFHGCRDETEIRRYGLLESENLETDIVDFEFELIQLIVLVDNVLGKRRLTLDERSCCVRNGSFCFVADQEQLFLQSTELTLIVFVRMFAIRHRKVHLNK